LVQFWTNDPSYSHGFLILPISAWLALRYIGRVGLPSQGQAGLGATGILLGCLFHLAAVVAGSLLIEFVGLALVLRGLAVTAGGRDWARGLAFPILFLFFMFPLPQTWTGAAAVWLQDWVSRISGDLLDLFIVCYRRGNSLFLPGLRDPLVVAEECSGLRQIVAFLALGALVGHLMNKGVVFQLLLIVAAVPVAIVANVCRILLMAFGAKWFGTSWLSGWMHDVPALVTLPLGLALFLLVGWGLYQCWPKGKADGL
jgi:exosortase